MPLIVLLGASVVAIASDTFKSELKLLKLCSDVAFLVAKPLLMLLLLPPVVAPLLLLLNGFVIVATKLDPKRPDEEVDPEAAVAVDLAPLVATTVDLLVEANGK